MKVDIELVKRVLSRNLDDIRKTSEIIEDLSMEAATVGDEPKPPQVKKQFVILVANPAGYISTAMDCVGWVLQIPEDDSPATACERLIRAAHEYNITPKGRRLPVRTIGEICEAVPARVLKDQNVWVKTKEPVQVCLTDNKLT